MEKIKNVGEKAINGISWTSMTGVSNQAMNVFIGIVLANLLGPEEFGLIALVFIFTGFANLLRDMGFGAAMIQKKDASHRDYSTVFWLTLGLGVFFSLLFFGLSSPISNFYNEPRLVSLVQVLAFNYLFSSFGVVYLVKLKKALRFKHIAYVEFASVLISGIVGIVMAFLGYGVWSLVGKTMTRTLVLTIGFFLFSARWFPSLVFDWQVCKELSSMSFNYTGTITFNYWSRRLDDFLIGKFMGATALGIYSYAYRLLLFPIRMIKVQMIRVMFPTFSNIQDEPDRIRSMALKLAGAISMVTYPIMLMLFFLADSFVLLVLGEEWLPIIPILRLFCFGVLLELVVFPGSIMLSQGKADLLLKVTVCTKLLTILCIIIGLNWGIQGVATGVTIAMLINFFPSAYFSGRLIGLEISAILKKVIPFFCLAFGSVGLVSLISSSLFLEDYFWGRLIMEGLLSVSLYALLLWLIKPFPYEVIEKLIRARLPKKS